MSGRWYLDDGDADAAARDDADVVLDLGVELVETALDVNALRRVGADEDVAAAAIRAKTRRAGRNPPESVAFFFFARCFPFPHRGTECRDFVV